MPATATLESHYRTCLGHLGQRNRDRIISISVTSPKVPRQVQVCCLLPALSSNLCQCKHGFKCAINFVLKNWAETQQTSSDHYLSIFYRTKFFLVKVTQNASKIICRGRAGQNFEFVKLILLMKMYLGDGPARYSQTLISLLTPPAWQSC
jgi:hypothetical protein